jgi:hypothetical protein
MLHFLLAAILLMMMRDDDETAHCACACGKILPGVVVVCVCVHSLSHPAVVLSCLASGELLASGDGILPFACALAHQQ